MDLTKQVIHDEANASSSSSYAAAAPCGGNETDISRELHISEAEYARKMSILDKLCLVATIKGGDFVSCSLAKKTDKEALYQIWTAKGACLNVNLSRRYGNKCYLGTRSSPTRILSGQNVVEISEVQRVEKVQERLSCTAFEARTILMFSMISKTVAKTLGGVTRMFTSEEMQDIKARRLNVATVGFATYSDFGMSRDNVLHLLGYLGSHQVSMEGDSFPLVSFLGNVSCKTWRKVTEPGYQGPNQGVVFTKITGHGVTLVKQMFYLKDEEIAAKENRHNEEVVRGMSETNLSIFKERLVRCDNTFFKHYLKQWVDSYRLNAGLNKLPEGDLLLKDIADMLDNKETVLDMCRVASNELGIRSLLLSPTMNQISALLAALGDEAALLVEHWRENCRVTVATGKKGSKLSWPDVLGSSPKNRKVAEKLYRDFYLDLRLPYDFYVGLNEARFKYFLTSSEQLALSQHMMGDSDKYGGATDLQEVKMRIRGLVHNLTAELKTNLNLTTTLNKRRMLASSNP